jgi:hypothetical protein
MAGRIQLKLHLTTEELQTRYRSCQKPQEKVRWYALYLISQGAVAAEAARRVGRASSWLTSLARRSNRDGTPAVARRQSTSPSHRAKVEQKLGTVLDIALRTPAPDGALWTAPKVAAWITRAGMKFIPRRSGVPCVGSALAFKFRGPPTSDGQHWKSSPSSKKDRT